MKLISSLCSILMMSVLTSCANANVSKSREAYILSQPHGWIEITLKDSHVPAELPPKDLTEDQLEDFKVHPPSCSLRVKLNNEIFLREPVFPFGDEPPYIVNTGFRFPAPVGSFKIQFEYSDCDIENNQESSFSFSTTISVSENMVSPIFFDGQSYQVEPKQTDPVVSLEKIYDSIKKLK